MYWSPDWTILIQSYAVIMCHNSHALDFLVKWINSTPTRLPEHASRKNIVLGPGSGSIQASSSRNLGGVCSWAREMHSDERAMMHICVICCLVCYTSFICHTSQKYVVSSCCMLWSFPNRHSIFFTVSAYGTCPKIDVCIILPRLHTTPLHRTVIVVLSWIVQYFA